WRGHKADVTYRTGHCTKLVRAIVKHGVENFSIAPLVTTFTQEDADVLEYRLILEHGTILNGYNLREGGSHGSLSAETRARMSAAHKGRVVSPETRAKITATLTGRKNGPRSDETRKKISDAHRGRTASAATKSRLSAAHRGKT